MFCPHCPDKVAHHDHDERGVKIYKCSNCKAYFEMPMTIPNKLTLLMMMGLPSAGKTTYTRSLINSNPNHIRVSRKDIQAELGWNPKNPDLLVKLNAVRDAQILDALLAGKSVISDDTNLDPEDETRLQGLAEAAQSNFKKQFLATSLEECLRRNSYRLPLDKVDESEIREMAVKASLVNPLIKVEELNPHPAILMKADPPVVGEVITPNSPTGLEKVDQGFKKWEPNENLMGAVIVNLDCLSIWDKEKREYCEYAKGHLDKVNEVVKKLIMTIHKYVNYQIIYMSGRPDNNYQPAIRFLAGNMCPQGPLYMRKNFDSRQEWIVFGEMLNQHVRGKYDVKFILDNDKDTIDFWRSIGLTVLQTDDGNNF